MREQSCRQHPSGPPWALVASGFFIFFCFFELAEREFSTNDLFSIVVIKKFSGLVSKRLAENSIWKVGDRQ